MAINRKRFTAIEERMENRLRQWCGRIPPRRRIAIVLGLLFLFSGLSVYITFSSLFHFGKDEKEKLNFRHLEVLQLELRDKQNKPDSLKTLNEFHYEKKRE